MDLGLSSYAYRWSVGVKGYIPPRPMNVNQFIDRAIHFRLRGVQVCDNLAMEKLSSEELRQVRRKIDDHHMFIETGGRGTSPDYLTTLLELSNQLGAKILRIVPEIPRTSPKENVEVHLSKLVHDFRAVKGVAKRLNVKIALENHATLSSEEILYVIRTVDDDFMKACVDTMNSVVLLESPLKTVETLAPYAVSVHLKDFVVEKHPEDHRIRGVALGEGFVDFKQILRVLKQYGTDPNLHLELYIDRKEDDEKTRVWEEDCVARSIRYARTELSL